MQLVCRGIHTFGIKSDALTACKCVQGYSKRINVVDKDKAPA